MIELWFRNVFVVVLCVRHGLDTGYEFEVVTTAVCLCTEIPRSVQKNAAVHDGSEYTNPNHVGCNRASDSKTKSR